MTSWPPIATAPGATSCSRTSASTSVVLPAPVGPTMASVAPAGTENETLVEQAALVDRDREVAHLDRRRDGTLGAAPARASRARRRRWPAPSRAARARGPARDAALPDADDPAERDRGPRQLHDVGVERDERADRHAPRDDLAPARPQHDERPRAPQHREERPQHAARAHEAQRAREVLVVERAEAPVAALLEPVVLDDRDAREVLLDRRRHAAELLLDLAARPVHEPARQARAPSSRTG